MKAAETATAAAGGRPVFSIACGSGAGPGASVETMGFKAFNLWRMSRVGLRVPPAFVLGTGFCGEYLAAGSRPPQDLRALLGHHVRQLEGALPGLRLGSPRKPLLVSVRSGAPVSMPGMMETVLDVGASDTTVRGMMRLTGNPRLAWDSYRRLVQSYAEVVHHCPAAPFDQALARALARDGLHSARDLDFRSLQGLVRESLGLFSELTGESFPQDPVDQLEGAIAGVWDSWSAPKAVAYRAMNRLSDTMGTAVTVQTMVFGNAGGTSGAGVGFSRDPSTGENALYLDFLFNAQGEDIVSGRSRSTDTSRLAETLPDTHAEVAQVARTLEREFGDMQEFEFTIQDARLYLLQTRAGKRTPWAALHILVEQADEGLITATAALERAGALDLAGIGRRRLVPAPGARLLCRGEPAGAGAASGEIVFDPQRACEAAAAGRSVILVRESTATEDILGIAAAGGLLTAAGGRTSHAAVVARQLDKACVVGCASLSVDAAARRCVIAGETFREGDVLALDGASGEVVAGAAEIAFERPADELQRLEELRRRAGAAAGASSADSHAPVRARQVSRRAS